jgi:hypothetical protein
MDDAERSLIFDVLRVAAEYERGALPARLHGEPAQHARRQGEAFVLDEERVIDRGVHADALAPLSARQRRGAPSPRRGARGALRPAR